MGEFKINFARDISYFDSEYSCLNLNVVVQAVINCQDRTGDEKDVKFVNGLISDALNKQFTGFERERVAYRDLVSKCDELSKAVSDILVQNKMQPQSVAVASIIPDERSMRSIELINRVNSVKNMSTDEYTKRLDIAQKTAQARLESMTPRGSAKDKAQAPKTDALDEESKKKLLESVKAGTAIGAAAGAVAGVTPANAAPIKQCCTNCGAPAGNGKFCRTCGKPLSDPSA